MKKLAITSVVVLIALIGFTTVLCLLPGGNCCGYHNRYEMHDGKCPHGQSCEGMEGKCEGMENGKCGMQGMENGKCGMQGMGNGKCGMQGMENGKCGMQGMGDGKSMMHSGCCCCCMMMMNMKGCNMDSMKMDSTHVKVRGKL